MTDGSRIPDVNIKDILRPMLLGLPEDDLDVMAQAAVVRAYAAGETICVEGEEGATFFIIVSGRVDMLKQFDDASERFLHDAGPGEFFGEMAIVYGGSRTATVRTAEPSVLLEIGQRAFLDVLGSSPALAIRILVQMTARLRDSDHQAIIALRETNEELRQALQQLERLDRTKSDFIQVSAHELRTPIAALKGYAQMMQWHSAVQSATDLHMLVEGIVTSTERLHRIFDSILDMSRVMDGGLGIHRSPVSFPVIFQGIHSDLKQALQERRLTMERQGLDELPLCPADPTLLYKAFQHLINNAIKYTPDGGCITITGAQVVDPELGPSIEIAVQDTGIGISPEDIALIFEKFYRTGEVALHSSGTTAFKGGGPGLGLAIARGIVVTHGGRIWAESPGYDEATCPGSRFIVRIPMSPPHPPTAQSGATPLADVDTDAKGDKPL
ncbi:MAG: cyclic nucleotide-binding domain-containing protein [Anaerolineae bacterium]|nr:cyclic nucleotide-binding domain-containing protein [Anaerolineae bacterium]